MVLYKGIQIKCSAYEMAEPGLEGKWCPRPTLIKPEGDADIMVPLICEKYFDTKEEAEQYALNGAKDHIDRDLIDWQKKPDK